MFEKVDFDKYMKDSEDYYDNREPITERKLYQLWKDGAEFGYNKGKNEAKELLKGIIDTPMYYQIGGEMYESEEYKELIAEAEQFLKEVKNDNRTVS